MSEKKWTRAEMWEYFSQLLKKGKITSVNDKELWLACVINADRLIIGIYDVQAVLKAVYYMTSSGTHRATGDGVEWNSSKIDNCVAGYCGYSWFGSRYKYQYISGNNEALDWLHQNFGHCWHNDSSAAYLIDTIELHIAEERRRAAYKRRLKKHSDYCNDLPALPYDFEEWVINTAFGGLYYAFGKKNSKKVHCSACGQAHSDMDYKHNGRYICPVTQKKINVIKTKCDIQRRERVMIVQSHHDEYGMICTIFRHFTAIIDHSASGYSLRILPDCVMIVQLNGATVCGDDIIYNLRDGVWDVSNTCGYQHGRCYLYPDVSALQGTAYDKIGIDAAAAKGWRLHYNNLMRGWHDDSRMEYLIKGGFYRLVDDMTTKYTGVDLFPGENAREVLGIDGQGIARLRQNDGGAIYLSWLRTAFMCGYKIPENTLRFFCEKNIKPRDIAFALSFDMSPEQVANYLQRPHGYKHSDRRYLGNTAQVVIRQWRDYIDMATKLKLDMTRESVYKPKLLKEKHDELTEILNAESARKEAERTEAEYPQIKPVCKKIKALYEWSNEDYCVIVPEGAADIKREGRLLNHCVGSTDRYFDRIATEESYIMFLRRASKPDAPWYTMEVEPGGSVRQLRTFGDDEGADRSEAKAFLKKWRREISSRMGTAEREAASVSREKRLQEFAELRKNGNIIRNGKFAGHLLVEVLEADFKEYNEAI